MVVAMTDLRAASVELCGSLTYVAGFLGDMGFCSMGGPDSYALKAIAAFEATTRSWTEPLSWSRPERTAVNVMVSGAIHSIEKAIGQYDADELDAARYALESTEAVLGVVEDAIKGQSDLAGKLDALEASPLEGEDLLAAMREALAESKAAAARCSGAYEVMLRGALDPTGVEQAA